MNEEMFKKRTKKLALNVIALIRELPKNTEGRTIGAQLIRSVLSIGANYRAACRGKSVPDMISKLCIVEEESDETIYWFELLVESGLVKDERVKEMAGEANEILAMTVASIKTLKR